MKTSIGMKISGAFALGLAALIVLGGLSYRNITSLLASSASVRRTYQTLGALESIVGAVSEAETGERGFVITGQDAFLEPYDAGVEKAGTSLDELRKLVTASDQVKNIDALQPLVAAPLGVFKDTIDIRRTRGMAAAQEYISSGRGKKSMDALRAHIISMEDLANRLLAERDLAAKASAGQTVSVILYGIPATFLLIVIAAILLVRGISIPLRKIAEVSDRLSAGDLTALIPQTNRRDEIGVLQTSFRRMVENLVELLRQTVEGISMLGTSASEILATTTEIATGAAETATGVSETTATVEEVKQTSIVASQKAKAVMDGAQHSVQISQAGRKSVEETLEGMGRIREQMESIATSIVRLSEQSQAIGEIISTVNDLAEQSNLLAVNAGIEAAKAGEQGRGFTVVAQEVKSLAQQSKQATAQIRGILGEVQKATGAAVLATEQGSKVVEAGVKQSVQVSEVIRQLSESVAEAAQATTQIAASSQQQLAGMDQVAQAMESIKTATAQNVEGIRQAGTAAQQLHELGGKLSQLVARYKV